MQISKISVASLVLLLSSGAMAGGSHTGGHQEAIGEVGSAANVSQTITVDMFDNYFEPSSLKVAKGETVRIKVSNKGNLVHEFNIGTSAMHEAHQEEMLMMIQHGVIQGGKLNREMLTMDMGNGTTMEHNDPNSVLLEPGETKEIIWKFSADAALEFACNVPGHYQAGMYGDIQFN